MLKTIAALIELATMPETPGPTSQDIEMRKLKKENRRLRAALAATGIPAHALRDPDTAGVLRISVDRAREIVGLVEGAGNLREE